MKNNKKLVTIGLIVCVFICIAVVVYSYMQIPLLQQKVIDKQESKKKIDTYLQHMPENKIENEKAFLMLDYEIPQDEEILYTYQTAEGFKMISYSSKWNEEKLIELYEELLRNEHGEEIELLYQVIVYAEESRTAAGTHSNEMQALSFELRFPSLPKESKISYYRDMGTIKLYNGDVFTRVEQFAHTLSHEYGHHFTFHYIFKNGNVENTEYEKMRELSDYDIRYYWWEDSDDYYENHHWYLIEIAAEDYVQLMGSPMTRNITSYKDVRQMLHGAKSPDYWDSKNGRPQENLMIPLAAEVEGLYDYFYKFIGDDYEPAPMLHEEREINIGITRGSSSQDSIEGMLYFTHYKLNWNEAYAGEGAIYTLVCYDENDYFVRPIKTVKSGEEMSAYIGTVSRATSSMIYWQYDEIDEGTKTFLVIVLFPDGTLRVSKPFTYTFK